MVGDLARRMAIANPSLEKPLHGEGVVLIDEVDLHLHPQWQRMILPRLMDTFPNCQFIVSTHSPQILGELKKEYGKIIPLRDGDNGIEVSPGDFNVFGQTSDVILADVMNTSKRNDDISKRLNAIIDAIDAGNLDKARKLKKDIEIDAEGIPEFAKIELLLHRKEKLGK
jgi:predicted ATP-binding protein involved in virulence